MYRAKADQCSFFTNADPATPSIFCCWRSGPDLAHFSHPQLRTSRAKNRLTHPRFLRLYQEVLKPSGNIHLKTDSPALYFFTKRVAELYGLKIAEDIYDVFAQPYIKEETKIEKHITKV